MSKGATMIEKLDLLKMFNERKTDAQWNKSVETTVNLLIDAVNKLETMAKNTNIVLESLVEENKMPVDPYVEQRRWIGCVCRFWCDNPDDTVLDYLDKIQTGENGIKYYGKETYDWFPHCEPILPTDNTIYKGEQQ